MESLTPGGKSAFGVALLSSFAVRGDRPGDRATRRIASTPLSLALDLSSNGRWILVQASSDDSTVNAHIEKVPYGRGLWAVIARRAVEASWNF